jgi:hypothetical protein
MHVFIMACLFGWPGLFVAMIGESYRGHRHHHHDSD